MAFTNKNLFSVIIAYYKNKAALELIFNALDKQSCQDFEIIVAEDDTKSTLDFIHPNFKIPVKQVFQGVDNGFRKNQVLNKAIVASEGQYIIFVDGDCIPHIHFIKSYRRHIDEQSILFGRRVMVSPTLTSRLYETKDITLLSWSNLVNSGSTRLKYGIYVPFLKRIRETGIWGHNWGVLKSHLLAVNGYDEDYHTAGVGEDVDIEYRLKKLGLKLYSIRFAAIQYHLDHKINYSQDEVNIGKKMFAVKIEQGNIRCLNGIEKL